MKKVCFVNLRILRLLLSIFTGTTCLANPIYYALDDSSYVDTLFMFNPDDLLDQPIVVFDWTQDIFTYFEVNSAVPYDVIAIEFQLISILESYYPGNPYEDLFPILFWEGTLEGDLELGRELYPTEDTGNPFVDVYSGLPGEQVASLEFEIPDSTYLYPNWVHLDLDTIASLQGLTENILVGGWPFIYYMVCDVENTEFANTFDNQNWDYWRIGGPPRSIRLIVRYQPTNSIDIGTSSDPPRFGLIKSFPNPFNNSTTIIVQNSVKSNLQINIYDISGVLIHNSGWRSFSAGGSIYTWNGTNQQGLSLTSGVYIAKVFRKTPNATSVSESSLKVVLLQ